MKTLLVQPPISSKVETYSAAQMVVPPLGLAYLAAMLEGKGYPVEILDAPAFDMNFNQVSKELERRKPGLIGITATTATIPEALETVEVAKKILPDTVTAIGGAHITFTQERTMEESPHLDIGCIGEGENTIVDLVRTLESGRDLKNVRGIIYRENGGRLVKTSPRPLIENLDDLPFPARHLLPMDRYRVFGVKRTLGTMMTSRGCPFNCTFCSSSLLFGKKFRVRSPKNVVDEIEHFQNTYKASYVEFIDDVFTLDRRRVETICDMIIERKLNTRWVCSARVDLMTRDIMKKLKEAGCMLIYFGVESAIQRVINLMKKGIKIEQIHKFMKWAKEFKVQTVASYVFGIPGETWGDAMQTIKLSRKLDSDYAQFAIATPFPGTELYAEAKKEGLLLTEDWSKYTVLKPVMRTMELSQKDLLKLLKKAYLGYYLRPKIIYRYIKRGYFKDIIVNAIGTYFKKTIDSWWSKRTEL